MKNLIFNFCYILGLFVTLIIRIIYSRYHKKSNMQGNKIFALDVSLIILTGIGMFIFPVLYIFFSWFTFTDYHIPDAFGGVGLVIFIIGIILLWKAHKDIGSNWTPTLQVRENQTLVTHGTYRYIRHPMYAAHLLWGIAQPLLLHNWIAGFSTLILILPSFMYRIPREEKMMLEFFGKKYQLYMNQTGRIFPRF
jgi:protein-S-isoprenylcysteine O-methyltransferase Ste14